ncbi:MAG: winged helix-turn-helix transcriptional regulator [Gammaproteobacteria bacterium]|nr:winged helix-turn-helix transcriptional regulator [Gammaproteobacteria bacterium]
MVNSEFLALCAKAWTLQILAHIVSGQSPRIAPMSHELGAGRTAITSSLEYLIDLGYVRRASGHGHPLRPAYSLTNKGEVVALWAAELDQILSIEEWSIARKTWSLPVLRSTASAQRFGEIRIALQPVTDRALSNTLKLLSENTWIRREVDTEAQPPSVFYSPCGKGQLLTPHLELTYQL